MRGKRTPDSSRAEVLAALLRGQSVDQAAKETGVPGRTIRQWMEQPDFASIRQLKRPAITELVTKLLETNLATLISISETVGRPEYIEKQPASEIAVLSGVIADKSFRILSAFAEAAESEADDVR